MAITFNWANYSNLTTDNLGVTSINVGATNANAASGVINSGDYLQASLGLSYSTTDPGTISGPAGWTQILQAVDTGTQQRIAVFRKIAGSSETGSYAFTWTNPTDRGISWILSDRSGVSSAAPVDTSGFQHNAASPYTAPSISPTGATDVLVGVWVDGGGQATYAVDPAMTARAIVQGTTLSFPMVMEGDQQLAASGATGTRTATSAASAGNYGALIALTPASGGGATDDRAFQAGAMQAITLMCERASGLLEPMRELWRPKRPRLVFP